MTPLTVDSELRTLCTSICEWMDGEEGWEEMESSDMFQSDHYCGGWEGEEEGFTFSYYDDEGDELWFSLSPSQVRDVSQDRLRTIETREPS